jgi:hypothetical protein
MKNRGREIIPLLTFTGRSKSNYIFSGISELVAVIKGDGACAAIIRLKCGNAGGQK